jgi:hypothetical protein
LFQQAFVVRDLERAQHAFTEALGCGDFVTLPPASLPYRYRGDDVECALAIAFARSGNVQIELIQPVGGRGLHEAFLTARGPGAHHLGFMVERLDDALGAATDAGYAEAMSGQFGSLRFAYVDTFDALGLYLELVEDPDGMMFQLMPWK